ncbi:MAG: right-handed parallel beta-helix repeat-containing protein [Gammaproteobacteria bacterium]
MKLLRHRSIKVLFVAMIFTLLLGVVSAQDQDKWTSYIEFSAKPGSDRSIAKGDLFVPIQQDEDSLLFGNLKVNFDDRSYKEGNAGIGVRKIYEEWIVGGWVFYDWKESTTGNTFDQMTVGGEFLSNDWDIRANAYVAENKIKDSDRASVIELNGNQLQARLGEERALSGVDFEVGRKLPFFENSRFFVGGYHYDESGYEKVSGPKLRFEMRFNDLPLFSSISKGSHLTLGAEYTEDSVRGSESFGLMQLRIPFGGGANNSKRTLSSLEKRMMETVQRDDDIITNERQGDTLMPLLNPKTGQVINVVETINALTADVAGEVATAGQNSLIIADGSQGDINVGTSTINTSPGQIIVGGGQQITLQALKSNGSVVNMSYTPQGQRGSISRAGSGELMYVNNDDDVTIVGVDLEGGRPIRINNSQNIDVMNTSVLNSASNRQGVYVHNNSSVNFENVSIDNTGRQGLLMTSNSTGVFTNLKIDNSGREGVYLTSNASSVFNDLSISNTVNEGFEITASTAVINNADINDSGREGLRIRNGSTVNAEGVTISKTGSEAIEVNNSELNLSNSVIKNIDVNANRDGIYATNNSILNLDNIIIDNVTSQGIITTNNTTSAISNTKISNTGHQGLYFSGNSTTSLKDVEINNAGRQGIYSNNATLDAINVDINDASNQGAYLLNTSAFIDSIEVVGAGLQGVYLNRNSDVVINDAVIRESAREGLYVRDSDLVISNSSISDITASANRDGIYIYRDSNVTLNSVDVSNVTGDGIQVQGTSALSPAVVANNLTITDAGRYGVINTRGALTLNNASISNSVFDGIFVNRGDLNVNGASIINSGRFGAYALRSNATLQNLFVANTARDGVLINLSTVSLNNSIIRDIGDGDVGDDAIQVIRSNVSGAGNVVSGTINSGVACRSTGINTGTIGFSAGPISSCP